MKCKQRKHDKKINVKNGLIIKDFGVLFSLVNALFEKIPFFFCFFFSNLFSVLDILMKHTHSCLTYYMVIGVTHRFSNSLLGVGYSDQTLILMFNISLTHVIIGRCPLVIWMNNHPLH